MSFYVKNRSSPPKIDPHVNFSNFQVEKNFHFVNFFSMRKEQQQSRRLINFAKIWSEYVLKTNNHKVRVS